MIFSFCARNIYGEREYGRVEAVSRARAKLVLVAAGRVPVAIVSRGTGVGPKEQSLNYRRCRREVPWFTEQLALLLSSGVTIVTALEVLAEQSLPGVLRPVITRMIAFVQEGASFSSVLAHYPEVFGQFYCAMVVAGEKSGDLPSVLQQLSDFLNWEERLRKQLAAALAYPVLILIVTMFTIAVLLGYVVPQLASLFEEMGQDLPVVTSFLICLSALFRAYGVPIVMVLMSIGVLWWRSVPLQKFMHIFKWHCAGIRHFIRRKYLALFFMALHMLTGAGVDIVQALQIARAIVGGSCLAGYVEGIEKYVTYGLPLSAAIKKTGIFPAVAVHMVRVSEETGTLHTLLGRLARQYEQQTLQQLQLLMKLVEPALIVVMGIVVGGVVMSLLLPVFQLSAAVNM